jgi:hypothetical protein
MYLYCKHKYFGKGAKTSNIMQPNLEDFQTCGFYIICFFPLASFFVQMMNIW